MRAIRVTTLALLFGTIAPAAAQERPRENPPAENSGGVELDVRPQPTPPAPPPVDLSPPRQQPSEPMSPAAPDEAAPQNDTSGAPPPAAWEADEPPRGEGAAAIPRDRPPAIKALRDWISSWFE